MSGTKLPLDGELVLALAVAMLWTGLAMAAGWGAGLLLHLPSDDRFTLLIEFATRNLAVALVVALGSFARLDLALFVAAYSVAGYPIVVALSVLRGRRLAETALPEEARAG